MPRSSRSKSHRQSKHSSKDARERSDSDEDVKMKDRNGKEDSSVRVSRDLASGEKRKLSSQSRDGKDPSSHDNGDASEEHVASKRRKEKADGGGSDRWNASGDERGDVVAIDKEMKGESSRVDSDKGSKSKDSKVSVDSKSKSSRRHESGIERKEENASSVAEKEETKGGSSRVDSKRKPEKDSGRKEAHSKESKEKDRGSDRARKVQDVKRDTEARTVDVEVARKQGSLSVDFSDDRQDKQGRENNTEWPIQDELRNPELEKELEKRIRRRGDGSSDKDKYQEDVRESDDGRLSSRGDCAKDGTSGDKSVEDGDRDSRHKEDKYREGSERDSRHKDVKYREDGERDSKYKDVKYREDGERGSKHKDVKYREDGERDNRHRDDKYREDGDRENKHRDDKYREDGDRDSRHREEKYHQDGDRDNRHREDKYREDGDRDDRHRDDKYREDGDRDNRRKEEKYREDVDRDSRHRDGKQKDDTDRDKRVRDVKYREERPSRDHPSESETKRLRDENNAADYHYRKSSNHDGSPIYDDRVTRYKDDKGRRKANDKEDHTDNRSRSTKEQRSDVEKRSMSSGRDLLTDRGRSNSRNADVEITLSHSRRRSSPSSSSHAARDHCRISKQEEPKYREYAYEERGRHNVISSREFAGAPGLNEKISLYRSLEKSIQKDDSHFGELTADRRPRSDAHASPLQLVNKSPSSTSADRRHLNRSDIRRGLDVEESGQRSGGSKDAKDYSSKEDKGNRELPMETFPVDEHSQADGDNLSASSPFTRTSHYSGNAKSLLPPPPPFRTGVDSPLVFGSSEDDNRGKSNNRHRRIGDPNMARAQGSGWKGVPNWPSPVANGFMPFPHGPPPVGFHPVMQQFPGPPIFGVRPSMELNHTVPYHIPDTDRFSGHGRSLGWRNPVDDSCPPPLHGWDATTNTVFGDESRMYGRLDWDHNRTQMSSRGWETSGDMWKGQNCGMNADLPSAPQKEDYSARGQADEAWSGQPGQVLQKEQNQTDLLADSINISQISDALERNTPEAPKTSEESPDVSKVSREDDARLCHIYLSKLDISADLTQPELYSQCTSLMDIDQNTISVDDSKLLYMGEALEAKVRIPDKTSRASLFAAISDSVFQKAMSLYNKQREEIGAINRDKVSFCNVENLKLVPTSDHEKGGSNDAKPGELAPACDMQEAEGAVSNSNQEKIELPSCFQKPEVCPVTICHKLDEPVVSNSLEKSEELVSTLNEVKMEVDPVLKQEPMDFVVEDKSLSLENMERSDAQLPHGVEDVNRSNNSGDNNSANNNEEQKLLETKCGPLLFSDVSSEACEAVMPESIESGSVNLSRIHHSPESTH